MTEKCIFLDKDGTLIYDVPYNVNVGRIVFYEDIFQPLQRLKDAGYKFIIVSNQSGIAKGLFQEGELTKAMDFIINKLNEVNIPILDYIYCPHDTDEHLNPTCFCRKPQPKMIMDMAVKYQIDLKNSWMVGDILADVEAGNRAGCHSILVDRLGTEITKITEGDTLVKPTHTCRNFKNLDALILN